MGRPKDVVNITGAEIPLSEDQRARTRRYLISMAIRTVCFLLAIVFTGWLRWGFILGAVFLPYVAVVMANAGRQRSRKATPAVILHSQPSLNSRQRPQL